MNTDAQKKLALTLAVLSCPNCGGQFHPKSDTGNFTNIRCGTCYFEAWFHAVYNRDKEVAFSIETEDMERIMAQKIILPPIILYWNWVDATTKIHWEVADLYPFIPYTFLHAADTSVSLGGQQNTLTVFLQSDELLPTMRIYTSPSDEEIAEVVNTWETITESEVREKFNFGYIRSARIINIVKAIRRKRGLADLEDEEEE